MESQPQNPEFRNNPENFHPCLSLQINICWGYSFQAALEDTSNENHKICFYGEIRKISPRLPDKCAYMYLNFFYISQPKPML